MSNKNDRRRQQEFSTSAAARKIGAQELAQNPNPSLPSQDPTNSPASDPPFIQMNFDMSPVMAKTPEDELNPTAPLLNEPTEPPWVSELKMLAAKDRRTRIAVIHVLQRQRHQRQKQRTLAQHLEDANNSNRQLSGELDRAKREMERQRNQHYQDHNQLKDEMLKAHQREIQKFKAEIKTQLDPLQKESRQNAEALKGQADQMNAHNQLLESKASRLSQALTALSLISFVVVCIIANRYLTITEDMDKASLSRKSQLEMLKIDTSARLNSYQKKVMEIQQLQQMNLEDLNYRIQLQETQSQKFQATLSSQRVDNQSSPKVINAEVYQVNIPSSR
jgi:hypothetical protein